MIIQSAGARAAIAECADFISRESLDAGLRFFEAAEATFGKLADAPGMGRPLASADIRLVGIRVWPVAGFPNYLIFYRPVSDGIEVIDVLHAARDLESLMG